MAQARPGRIGDQRSGASTSIDDIKEFLESKAAAMEMSGFMQEAGGLRRWAAELARKSTEADFGPSANIMRS